MDRRTYLSVLGGVALAGCAGGGGDPAPEPTETPSPRPTSTRSLDDLDLPEGVTADGVSPELLTAHQQLVIGEPYTVEWQSVVGDRIRDTTIQIGADAVHQDQRARNGSSKSFYKDAEGGFGDANGGEYYFRTSQPIDRGRLGRFDRIADHLEAADYAPTGVVQGDGRPLIRAESTDATLTDRLRRRGISELRSYQGTLLVGPDGQLVEWTFEWAFDRGGDTTEQEFDYRTSAIGSTTVTEPSWLGTARDEAFSFTLRGPEDGSTDYLAVDVGGGAGTLPSNLYAQVSTRERTYGSTATESMSGGDTLYLGVVDGGLRVRTDDDFSAVDPLEGEVRVHLSFNGVYVLDSVPITL